MVLLVGLALLGLLVGSFLTVVIRRVGTGITVVRGRSRCPACGHTLRWFELLPGLSFLLQGGRCRSCGRAITWFYPAVELTTAFLFVGLGWAAFRGALPPPFASGGASAALPWLGHMAVWLPYYLFFAATAVAVSFYDFERRLIPTRLIKPLLVLGLAAQGAGLIGQRGVSSLLPAVAVAGGSFLLFWSLWFFSAGRAMGRGDADVALAIGLTVGPAIGLLGLLLAFWMGAFFGILMVLAGRLEWSSRIPFAPFLFGGALVALFLAPSLGALNPLAYVR